jgi:hypothetical protein
MSCFAEAGMPELDWEHGLTLLHEMIRIRRFEEKSVDVVHGVMKQIGF